MRNPKDLEFEEEYQQAVERGEATGSITNYMETKVKNSLSAKMQAHLEAVAQRDVDMEKDRPHTYAEITKAIPKALARINSLKDQPAKLVKEKRVALNKEFDDLVKREAYGEHQRELWISEQVVKFMGSVEYMKVKQDLTYFTNLYSECLALKEEWEKDNADIIEAERVRSKRAELMQADPETLKALGITPDPTFTAPKVEEKSPQAEMIENLRAIHPSATDAELSAMAKLV